MQSKIHYFLRALLICGFLFLSANAYAAAYLSPGVDSYNEMVKTLGKPLRMELTSDGKNFYYKNMIVNISGSDQTTILTVSYLQPKVYLRYPNLDVGMSAEEIKSQLSDYYEHKESTYHFITDYQRSLIFWIENGKVSKLVQARPNSLKRLN